jgi:hypothetical protein
MFLNISKQLKQWLEENKDDPNYIEMGALNIDDELRSGSLSLFTQLFLRDPRNVLRLEERYRFPLTANLGLFVDTWNKRNYSRRCLAYNPPGKCFAWSVEFNDIDLFSRTYNDPSITENNLKLATFTAAGKARTAMFFALKDKPGMGAYIQNSMEDFLLAALRYPGDNTAIISYLVHLPGTAMYLVDVMEKLQGNDIDINNMLTFVKEIEITAIDLRKALVRADMGAFELLLRYRREILPARSYEVLLNKLIPLDAVDKIKYIMTNYYHGDSQYINDMLLRAVTARSTDVVRYLVTLVEIQRETIEQALNRLGDDSEEIRDILVQRLAI